MNPDQLQQLPVQGQGPMLQGQPMAPQPQGPPPPDIRDIVPPGALPDLLQQFLVIGACLVAGALLITLLVVIGRKRGLGRRATPPPPLPRKAALSALERLEEEQHWMTANELGLRLSNIIKRYFHHRYSDPILFETSQETLRRTRQEARQHIPGPRREALEQFLQRCDTVKYSNFPGARDQVLPLLDDARRIISDSSSTVSHG